MSQLAHSRALWNRSHLELGSDEVLAQILDRGSIADWRELHALAREDRELRGRILSVVRRVPVPLPHFWLALLRALGDDVDVGQSTPEYDQGWL